MGSHSVAFPLLPQPKLVLDLPTLEGSKAELVLASRPLALALHSLDLSRDISKI